MIDFLKNELSAWEYLKSLKLPIMMYGMGNGADSICAKLEAEGLDVSEYFASDDFVRGQSFHGKRVKKLSDIEAEYDNFVIVIAFGTQLFNVMDRIKSIANRHTVIVPTMPVYGNNIFDKKFVNEHEDDILKVCELFEEEISKNIYRDIIKFQFTGKLEYLISCESSKDEAYQNILNLGDNESYLDLGAYRGDTVDEFLKYTNGNYENITALEPDPKSFKKLVEHCQNLHDFTACNAAVWSENCEIFFDKKGGRMSSASKCGVPISAITIDSLNQPFTYIKMDVEGSEKCAILGGINTIEKYKPKLNIALYHRGEDIFTLPLLIHKIQPGYKLFIRHHPYIPAWDTNLYCI